VIGSIVVTIIRQTGSDVYGFPWSIILSFLFPTYSIANIFTVVYSNELARQTCDMFDCSNSLYLGNVQCCGNPADRIYTDNILTDPGKRGILYPIVFFFIEGFLCWVLILSYEYAMVTRTKTCCNRRKNRKVADVESEDALTGEDSDVIEEQNRVKAMNSDDAVVIVNDVKKWQVTIAIGQPKNCFGLLGVNGAGKTTTFQMLTGENRIDDGDAFINGLSVKTDWIKAGRDLGYCPQFDAVIKEMTGEETLYMFARIRGIPAREIRVKLCAIGSNSNKAEKLLKFAGGCYHSYSWHRSICEKQIKSYSGGNKRRLSLGIALIGLPSVLLLDEPTTGVDVRARRIIWNIFTGLQSLGTSLVLTSHSMDECEALCTELAIMVNGRFRCYGSCQHIKSRYGDAFTLLIRLRRIEDADVTKSEVQEAFSGAVLKEHHLLQMNYEIPRRPGITWSMLFDKTEEISRKLDFEDYSLSQSNLEQVFLEFSREAASSEGMQHRRNGTAK
ncbi:ABC transporter, ATP-binding protein, partial [Oesophagostomum dentatum]